MTPLVEVQYLPPIAYFCALQGAQEIIVEKYEHYEKQTYRSRCVINSVHGKMTLTIPVVGGLGKIRMCDVQIDQSQKWLNHHWRTIQSAYGKAPFFEYYAPDLYAILHKKHPFLYDLDLELLTLCLGWLKWGITIRETTEYKREAGEGIIDLRSAINAKKNLHVARFYKPVVYTQVFGNNFVENLSLIDLIFCEGPGARALVQASIPK